MNELLKKHDLIKKLLDMDLDITSDETETLIDFLEIIKSMIVEEARVLLNYPSTDLEENNDLDFISEWNNDLDCSVITE